MFTIEERDHVWDWIIELARSDSRVTAAAMIGSLAAGVEDRWSDLDLTFGVAEGTSPEAVLDDWRDALQGEFGLLHYWDLPFRTSLYRVFLFPNGLEADLSVTPQSDFGPRSPRFQTIFGSAQAQPPSPPPSARFLIGLCWHHVLHVNASIERGKPWRAEYWLSALRDHTLELACLRLGEDPVEARGMDRLPAEVTAPLSGALVRSLDTAELRRALGVAASCYLTEVSLWDADLAANLTPTLRDFAPGMMAARQ